MPFDGTDYARSEAIARLDRAIGLLANERSWVKRVLETADGRRCIMGALRTADAQMLEPFVCAAIEELTGKRLNVVAFNDTAGTTHAMVLQVMLRSRELVAAADAAIMECILSPAGARLHEPARQLWA
ncbi:MAG: DUF6197 family protein [Stellaceae bacterium]